MSKTQNSFETAQVFEHNNQSYHFHSLKKFESNSGNKLSRLPFSLKILLENLLRKEDGMAVQKQDVLALAKWDAQSNPNKEIQFTPSRIILQDFTGVPAVADLAAMRGAIQNLGGDASKINPKQPADLVIDHSVQVDHYASPDAAEKNTKLEFERNNERYEFLKWGQNSYENFRVVPPGTGIVHQINLEYLSHVAMNREIEGKNWIYPDTLVGTDSHTTMINGLGVVGWGVGGIEAEAAMLGQPITMLIPQVIGFELTGQLPIGATATDMVLTIVQILRKKGVVGKFVEFYGSGLAHLSLADRATIANMAPEYGATIGLFPIDERTTDYLKLTGREEQAELVKRYYQEQGLWYSSNLPTPEYSDTLTLDLTTIEPSLAGPSRPQDRVAVPSLGENLENALPELVKKGDSPFDPNQTAEISDPNGKQYQIGHGSVVIAAITSCTNTSNPSVLIAAGLLARKAYQSGLRVKPWVKTSLAPGSKVVSDYLVEADLMKPLESLGFHVVGYGCTTCIGNSGPLPEYIVNGIQKSNLAVASVLSGNRNFEGRVNPHVRANYLASPPLVVAYALAGTTRIDLTQEPLGNDSNGKGIYLKDIWPTQDEINSMIQKHINSNMFQESYSNVFLGDQVWRSIQVPSGDLYQWKDESTYIKEPPFFHQMAPSPEKIDDIRNARVLALLKDSVTTDHISPAGAIQKESPAGTYLTSKGVNPKDFNSFGSRRGNHEVMVRGTFGNIRLRNQLAPGTEGGWTKHFPDGKVMTIYDASMQYQEEGTPLVVLAGKEYGTGSSRDWAAKGTRLLGVRAVITESFERIHRSNLIGMGVLPLQFKEGESTDTLGLDGSEQFDIEGISELSPRCYLKAKAKSDDGKTLDFELLCRIDTPNELEYFKHGGILQYVLRQSLRKTE